MDIEDVPSDKTHTELDHESTESGADANANPDTSLDNVFQLNIKLPHQPYHVQIMVSTQEQVQDLRQTIMETPKAIQYSCFHLAFDGNKVNDYIELSEVPGLSPDSEMTLIEDPYTEREARLHFLRTREVVGINNEKMDSSYGIAAGTSLHDYVCWNEAEDSPPSEGSSANQLADYSFDGPPQLQTIIQSSRKPSPKTIKSLTISPWNPPPPQQRQLGHLLYLQLTTNEGEQFQITSHISGFFASRSSSSKFDPYPRQPPKEASAHSLLTLISSLSPSFEKSFDALVESNSKRDPLVNFQLTNAIPASPWLISPTSVSLGNHQPDIARTQENYLMSGPDGNETLRDWNEELQSTRELPRETVQERVFRERLISKTYAEFTDAAVKGAVMVVRGEVAPLNPTEISDAQIFVHNNVFYSFGADGVGTFTSEGGDEAARVAVAKDVSGVKAVNQLDVKGLSTAGTIVVDYLGKRVVAQSIVPGIFKQREPDEHQVDYGGVEGRDIIADNAVFVPTFSQVSKLLKVKQHSVWDKDGKRHDLEASVETKGLLGTDGRKYILDLYRLTPLDISWIEDDQLGKQDNRAESTKYPHRMTVLRSELIDSYWRLKMSEYVKTQLKQREQVVDGTKTIVESEEPSQKVDNGDHKETASNELTNGETSIQSTKTDGESPIKEEPNQSEMAQGRVDISAFSLAFNPDVFCGQQAQSEEDKSNLIKDEEDVRAVCSYLHDVVFSEFLHDLKEAEIGFPMDGASLTALLHKRGINVRYLGKIATIAGNDARGRSLKTLAENEMISRAFKHEALRYLKNVPTIFTASAVAHLLNCLLGIKLNEAPTPSLDKSLSSLFPDANLDILTLTPETLCTGILSQVARRFRYVISSDFKDNLHRIQLLRSICLKLGIQLVKKDYHFSPARLATNGIQGSLLNGSASTNGAASSDLPNGHEVTNGTPKGNSHGLSNGLNKKKKKGAARPIAAPASESSGPALTFLPEDIANIVPVVKDSSPKSILADEALEAGKISMMQNQREIGQELLLESLTLHEQIYGVLHPEVARVYHQLATLYFQLDEKAAAIELAHKAVIISERTLGVDSSETILSYLNLALFEHSNRNSALAVACVRHALELWNIVYGHDHPDIVTTYNNAAVMLQQLQNYKQSRSLFEKSLEISEQMSGRSSVSTGTLLFQLAQALVLDGDHKGAVHKMREAYSIFLSKLGPDDQNTKESEKWLEQLTQNAVSMAKHAKDVQARRIRRILFNPRASRLAADSQAQFTAGQASLAGSNHTRNPSALDSRSIDELMKFIEGGGEISKAPPPKKKDGRGNPRMRGAASVGQRS